jgi:hypothetical protein
MSSRHLKTCSLGMFLLSTTAESAHLDGNENARPYDDIHKGTGAPITTLLSL